VGRRKRGGSQNWKRDLVKLLSQKRGGSQVRSRELRTEKKRNLSSNTNLRVPNGPGWKKNRRKQTSERKKKKGKKREGGEVVTQSPTRSSRKKVGKGKPNSINGEVGVSGARGTAKKEPAQKRESWVKNEHVAQGQLPTIKKGKGKSADKRRRC